MRTLQVLFLSLLLGQTVSAETETHIYEVRKGEVWDWHDVLAKPEHYRGRSGLGLEQLLARLNGSPKLKPGIQIRLAPLDKMLEETEIFQRWPEARVLLRARKLAKSLDAENSGDQLWFPIPDRDTLKKNALRINLKLDKFVEGLPRRVASQVRQVMGSLKRLANLRQGGEVWNYKDQMRLHRRIGLSFLELHKSL